VSLFASNFGNCVAASPGGARQDPDRGIFAKVPGLDFGYRVLTRVLPLGRAPVTERAGELYIGG
jgi:hypothetical protein